MAFQQGLSGLNAASRALDVTSNNIANSSTVGFKSSASHFADIYAASLGLGGSSQVGIGVGNSAIAQQFTQGNTTTTSNTLDIAINGSGFYRLSQVDGSIAYSRSGQFHLDKNGYVVNDNGDFLTGYKASSTGSIVSSTPVPLQVSTASIPPQATGSTADGVHYALNLDSTDTVPTTAWTSPAGTATPATDTYNYSDSLTIYDTLGNAHNLTMYYVKGTPTAAETAAGATGAWDVHYQVDGTSEANVTSSPQRLTFDSGGTLTSTMPIAAFSVDLDGVMTDLGETNAAGSPLSFEFDFTETTQFGQDYSPSVKTQDGYAAGNLSSLNISKDGIVQGVYSNGETMNLGQIVLANFTNPNGLLSTGNNAWVETAASGQPIVGTPNTGTFGLLQSGAVEDSNVDLTAELVNMIVEQRNYQANSQSIKTQDQILQTLVNIR